MKVTLIFGVLVALLALAVANEVPKPTEEQQANFDELLAIDKQGHENVGERNARQWGRGGGVGGGWGRGGGGGWGRGGGGGWGRGGGGGWGRGGGGGWGRGGGGGRGHGGGWGR